MGVLVAVVALVVPVTASSVLVPGLSVHRVPVVGPPSMALSPVLDAPLASDPRVVLDELLGIVSENGVTHFGALVMAARLSNLDPGRLIATLPVVFVDSLGEEVLDIYDVHGYPMSRAERSQAVADAAVFEAAAPELAHVVARILAAETAAARIMLDLALTRTEAQATAIAQATLSGVPFMETGAARAGPWDAALDALGQDPSRRARLLQAGFLVSLALQDAEDALPSILEAHTMEGGDPLPKTCIDSTYVFCAPSRLIIVGSPDNDWYGPNSVVPGSDLSLIFGPHAHFLILDLGGDDLYETNVGAATLTPVFIVADPIAGAIVSVGLDPEGDDSYGSENFYADITQGAGVGNGVGFLSDADGDDRYLARYGGQGVSAGESVGILADSGGSNEWNLTHGGQGYGVNLAVGALVRGAGPDVRDDPDVSGERWARYGYSIDGVALALDAGGMDDYLVFDLGLAMSMFSGSALFLDLGGADQYTVVPSFLPPEVFGSVCIPCGEHGRLALFADIGSVDSYSGMPLPGNDVMWAQGDGGRGVDALSATPGFFLPPD